MSGAVSGGSVITLRTIEQVRGTMFDDTIYGTGNDDFIIGLDGDDLLVSAEGDDTIYTGRGDDEVRAGSGNDLIFAAEGDNLIRGGSGIDTLSFDTLQTGEARQTTEGWTPEETRGSVVADLQTGQAVFIADGATEVPRRFCSQ